jgi:hypothetical protein
MFSLEDRELRSWLVSLAVLGAALIFAVVGWQLTTWGLVERVSVSLFPGGTPVPLTVISAGGPAAHGRSPLIASTSMDAVRHEVAGTDCTPERCWSSLQPPPGMLLIATAPPDCAGYERLAFLSRKTLVIRVIDECPEPAPGTMLVARNLALLGVPSNHLPRGMITVELNDDRAPRATVNVTLQ